MATEQVGLATKNDKFLWQSEMTTVRKICMKPVFNHARTLGFWYSPKACVLMFLHQLHRMCMLLNWQFSSEIQTTVTAKFCKSIRTETIWYVCLVWFWWYVWILWVSMCMLSACDHFSMHLRRTSLLTRYIYINNVWHNLHHLSCLSYFEMFLWNIFAFVCVCVCRRRLKWCLYLYLYWTEWVFILSCFSCVYGIAFWNFFLHFSFSLDTGRWPNQ